MTRRSRCFRSRPVSRTTSRIVRGTNTATATATAVAVNRNVNILVGVNEDEERVAGLANTLGQSGGTTSPEELLSRIFDHGRDGNEAEAEGRAIVRNNNINVVVNVAV